MGRTLPPANSLRAFEAAAWHLSFTKAPWNWSPKPVNP